MLLIADSGSSKTTWRLIDSDKNVSCCTTGGINPYFLCAENIVSILETELTLPRTSVSQIFFYGAGCVFPDKKRIVADALSLYFKTAEIEINSDLLAAARSLCRNSSGIACILGTGSNSCYYNGHEIKKNIPPLGYILGDEGSGNAMGRKLIADILKNQLPEEIRNIFFRKYLVTIEEILDNVYNKPFPNRYLAQYAKFVSENIDYPEMQTIASDCLREFFRRNLMQYDVKSSTIHFTGGIAFHFSDIIKKIASEFEMNVGNISLEPMEDLLKYHQWTIATMEYQ